MMTTRTPRSFVFWIGSGLLLTSVALLGRSHWSSNTPRVAQTLPEDSPAVRTTATQPRSGLHARYEAWAKSYARSRPQGPVLTLMWNRGLSVEHSKAKGIAQLDLATRSVQVRIQGLHDDGVSEVWLVDNQPGPGHSEIPEPGDRLIHVGSLSRDEEGNAWLNATVPELASLRLDSVVIARQGKDPGAHGVLYGSTTLFQKIFHYDKAAPGEPENGGLIRSAHAQGFSPRGYFDTLDADLVNEGRRLFFNETFAGNGRTCGTCHREEDNLALTPRTIATLPDDDPLFIVEQPTLADGTPNPLFNEFRMERPVLMRRLGLILENLDGFRDTDGNFTTRAVMRAPTHTLSMRTTLAPPPAFADDGTLPLDPSQLNFTERTGWSGDGSPTGFQEEFFESNGRELTGSLRDFTVGAVIQHFPRSIERSTASADDNGPRTPDFRLPTEEELDAMEAFMLSAGSTELPPDLNDIKLLDPIAERGRRNYLGFNIFDATPDDGRPPLNCQACHRNGGAMTNPEFAFPPSITPNHDLDDLAANGGQIPSHNRSFGPGVERLADQPGDILAQSGLGPSVQSNCSDQGLVVTPLLAGDAAGTPSQGCDSNPFDNGFQGTFAAPLSPEQPMDRFNAPRVFEALDNPPFFHGHQVNTIEGMVAFYATNRHFRNGEQAGAIVPLNASQVVNVARFLRVMGADFNVQSAINMLVKAAAFADKQVLAREHNANLAAAEIDDAITLLDAGDVHFADVVPHLRQSLRILEAGRDRRFDPSRHARLPVRSRAAAYGAWDASNRSGRNHERRRNRDHGRGDRPGRDPNHGNDQIEARIQGLLTVIERLQQAQTMMVDRPTDPEDQTARVNALREASKDQKLIVDPATRALYGLR